LKLLEKNANPIKVMVHQHVFAGDAKSMQQKRDDHVSELIERDNDSLC